MQYAGISASIDVYVPYDCEEHHATLENLDAPGCPRCGRLSSEHRDIWHCLGMVRRSLLHRSQPLCEWEHYRLKQISGLLEYKNYYHRAYNHLQRSLQL